MGYYFDDDELEHHGIKGQKWGVRRFQNEDGTLTPRGVKRYGEKVTMHNKKDNILLGGNKYQTHKEYVTANKYAKGSYEYRKAKIKEEKENSEAGTVAKNIDAMRKNLDNRKQYNYELARNRLNAGATEVKREIAVETAKRTAAAAAVVGAGVLAGMVSANYKNNQLKKGSASKISMNGMENYYEYKIGKKEVAKYLGKAVAIGALTGATNALAKNYKAEQVVNRASGTRKTRATDDERRWKQGKVGGSTGEGRKRHAEDASKAGKLAKAAYATYTVRDINDVINASNRVASVRR